MINRECKTLALPVAFPGEANQHDRSASRSHQHLYGYDLSLSYPGRWCPHSLFVLTGPIEKAVWESEYRCDRQCGAKSSI